MAAIGGNGIGVLAKTAVSETGPMQRGGAELSTKTAAFDAAMARSSAAPAQVHRVADVRPAANATTVADPTKVTQPGADAAVAPGRRADATQPALPSTTDAAERARRALDLAPVEKAHEASEPGDRILDGLSRIRGVFDGQQARMTSLASESASDVDRMIGLQVEVMNFSILVEVASKLTGKSTSALETLMKG